MIRAAVPPAVDLLYPYVAVAAGGLFVLPGFVAGRVFGRWGWFLLLWPPACIAYLRANTSGEFTVGGMSSEFVLPAVVGAVVLTAVGIGAGVARRRARRSHLRRA